MPATRVRASTGLPRRRLLAGTAAGVLAAPSLSHAQRRDPRVLRFIPNTGLTVLDPIWTSSLITGNHGYAVYDTLYGSRSDFSPAPQMADGHTVDPDFTDWRIRLRENLWFHDGSPVLASDCIASIRRWARRDAFGTAMMRLVDELSAPDDRTIRFRFKQRFPRLPVGLGRTFGVPAFMMPARLAAVDPFTPIKEAVGSGPYRFVAEEFNTGARAVYRKFDRYAPRQEAPNGTAGGKVGHFERIEWTTMADHGTAIAAMQSGEMDWWESTPADLRDLVRRSRNLRLSVKDAFAWMGALTFNVMNPPFDNVRLRRAFMSAINQEDFLLAAMGEGDDAWRECRSYFPCNAPFANEIAGSRAMPKPQDLAAARKAVADSGYNGEKVALLVATDIHHHNAFGQVSGDLLRRLGMNLDFQAMDWGTLLQRIQNKGPTDKGGWSLYHSAAANVSTYSPGLAGLIRGDGGSTNGYRNPHTVRLTEEWRNAAPDAPQQAIYDQLQQALFDDPPFAPLGQYSVFTTHGRDIDGILPGVVSYPWNVRRV
jgi:peptide/nickel transport system substrate-binding protein